MLRGTMRSLTKLFRTRAVILIALAYAFCVLAPSAALAVADNPASFRCLDDLNAMSTPSHHEGLSHARADVPFTITTKAGSRQSFDILSTQSTQTRHTGFQRWSR